LGLVRTDVSEEIIVSIIRVTGIGELGTGLVVTSNVLGLLGTSNVLGFQILDTLMVEVIYSSETSFLTRFTLRHIPEDDILLCESAIYSIALHGRKNDEWERTCKSWHIFY
jgi:hypothetical protein